jgi:hypothetical protein
MIFLGVVGRIPLRVLIAIAAADVANHSQRTQFYGHSITVTD